MLDEVHGGIINPYNQLSNTQLGEDFVLYNLGHWGGLILGNDNM